MWLWLRRRFLTGFFVTVPLFISVAALVWIFGIVDGLTTPFYDRLLGRRIPGLGTLTTAVAILAGGRRGDQRDRQAPAAARRKACCCASRCSARSTRRCRQLVIAFSPDNESGFKRVVLIEDAKRGFTMGFLTKEFTVERGRGVAATVGGVRADQPPLSGGHRHLRARARDVSRHPVEEGIRIFLTGGMAFPPTVRGVNDSDRDKQRGDFRV